MRAAKYAQPRKEKSKFWKGHGQISGKFFSRIKRKAKQRGIAFNVTIEYLWSIYIGQRGRCALTGVKLTFPKTSRAVNACSASLDRIFSDKPYERGNVQWTHKKINMMKQSMEPKDFVLWCKKVARFFESKRKK